MKTIKVLVVDDSKLIRDIVSEILNSDPEICVVGCAEDPYEARQLIKQLNPDVLTLDVEMPKMDGITFLSNLMRLRPMPVVMLSSLTTKGADITLQALEIGAVDYIAKPSADLTDKFGDNFKERLIAKVKQAALIDPKALQLHQSLIAEHHQYFSFHGVKQPQHLIAIGASTGGNDAIKAILSTFPENAPPVVITQHIPKVFSNRFAHRLDHACKITVLEAEQNQKILSGHAYIAPGGLHLTVKQKKDGLYCVLHDGDKVNLHKPSVDVMFNSLIPIAHSVQAVLLTGMGHDGAQGMLALKQRGARTIIQDKSSALIWGMPGSAYKLQAHTTMLPLTEIAPALLHCAELDQIQMKALINHEVQHTS